MATAHSFRVRFTGDFACFSRPEFKVERITYPVMTPSAARGALEAIFWKPEIRWEVRRILVLSPIRTFTIIRNEIDSHQSLDQASFIVERRRQQRSSLLLRDVDYVVEADMVKTVWAGPPIEKWSSQFARRLDRGQCFHRPYLGTREFPAHFHRPSGADRPISDNRDIGTMLLEIARVPSQERKEMVFTRHGPDGPQSASGYAQPLFFKASLNKGVLEVPKRKYQELRDLEEN